MTVARNFSGPHAANDALGLAGVEEAFVFSFAALFIAFKADTQVLHDFFECSESVST
jgi:hypothetical protein